jgi:hypothetical protein
VRADASCAHPDDVREHDDALGALYDDHRTLPHLVGEQSDDAGVQADNVGARADNVAGQADDVFLEGDTAWGDFATRRPLA